MSFKSILIPAGLVAAATFGAGVFALPAVFADAGWALSIGYLVLLSLLIVVSHILFLEVLSREDEKQHLVGLARRLWGQWGYFLALVVVLGGLFLGLVVYLILAGHMVAFFFPSLGWGVSTFLFWILVSALLFFEGKQLVGIELWGTLIKAALVLIVFVIGMSVAGVPIISATPLTIEKFFLPFGPILFALAGWSAVDAIHEFKKKQSGRGMIAGLTLGTFGVAGLYALFVRGIFGSTPMITPDTLSGFSGGLGFEVVLLGVLGLTAIGTVYLTIARETTRTLTDDVHLSRKVAQGTVIIAPLILIIAGLSNLSSALSLTGGVAVSAQYLLIVAIAWRILHLSGWRRVGAWLVMAIFSLAIIYEIYYFVR